MSERSRNKGRFAIYAMAGIFILSESYNLMKALQTETENRMLLTVFMILFAIIGVAMVIGGTYGGYKLMKADRQGDDSAPSLPEESEEAEDVTGNTEVSDDVTEETEKAEE